MTLTDEAIQKLQDKLVHETDPDLYDDVDTILALIARVRELERDQRDDLLDL